MLDTSNGGHSCSRSVLKFWYHYKRKARMSLLVCSNVFSELRRSPIWAPTGDHAGLVLLSGYLRPCQANCQASCCVAVALFKLPFFSTIGVGPGDGGMGPCLLTPQAVQGVQPCFAFLAFGWIWCEGRMALLLRRVAVDANPLNDRCGVTGIRRCYVDGVQRQCDSLVFGNHGEHISYLVSLIA